jgi:hypothetical protein
MAYTAAMTAMTHPIPRQRPRFTRAIAGVTKVVVKTAAEAAVKAVTPHKASVKRLGEIPLSCLGTGGIDFSAFHVNHGVGWLVLGISLYVIEHLIADPPDGAA